MECATQNVIVGLRRTNASFVRVVRERVLEGVERCTRAVDVAKGVSRDDVASTSDGSVECAVSARATDTERQA